MEIPILRADGSVWIALWNSATLFAADGTTAIATIAQGQDITERKQAEEETRSTEERFRLLFDSAMDGILLIDMENRQFKMGNRTICTMLGYSREEIPQLGVTNIHPEENLPHVIDVLERHARGELVVSPGRQPSSVKRLAEGGRSWQNREMRYELFTPSCGSSRR